LVVALHACTRFGSCPAVAKCLLLLLVVLQDLVAAMTPQAVAQLNSLAADASKIDANPATTTLLAGLENPVNGAQLLTQMAQLSAEAPAAAAPAGGAVSAPAGGSAAAAPAAAAPAPANGAGAQGVAVMATAGAALLAALLL
jgi:hypothetical protein